MNNKRKVTWTYGDGKYVECGVATVMKMWMPVFFKQLKRKLQCVVYVRTKKDYHCICADLAEEGEVFFMRTKVRLVSEKKFDRLKLKHNNDAYDKMRKEAV